MKILILGKNGQVGWELCRTTVALGEIIAIDYPEIDFANPDSIRSTIRSISPDIVINAAAYTAVDKAESEIELAMAINGMAPGVIAEEAKRINAVLIHYSTDYVYDGEKKEPYCETDVPNPLNVYGKTKLAGDIAIQAVGVPHLIFRTSWVYGWRGHNFLLTMLRLSREKVEIKVVDDQYGAPTWSRAIAEITAQVVAQGARNIGDYFNRHSGIYNLSAGGSVSWYGFAKAILDADPAKHEHKVRRLLPIPSAEYNTAAVRPKMSLLNGLKFQHTFNLLLPEWDRPLKLWR